MQDAYWPVFIAFLGIVVLLYLLGHPRLMLAAILAMIVACNYAEFAHADEIQCFPVPVAIERQKVLGRKALHIEGNAALDLRTTFRRTGQIGGDGDSYLAVIDRRGVVFVPVIDGHACTGLPLPVVQPGQEADFLKAFRLHRTMDRA
ncbi:hypothetical protein [Methylosinus sp. PW1]|uniref:hypothetical protein n=1 Tax=Methylosinus sp. PW1 TaxID=107636 RepID=UPI00055A83DF|nr:hypothetical protein [Methylosinus sp. PW1]